MPELPDIVVYIEALEKRILGQTLQRVRLASPFLLRTAAPPISSVEHKHVIALRRMGKRICIGLEDNLWLVLHLMIAGRLHWKDSAAKINKRDIAAFEFDNGTLTLTEAGTQKRASLHVVAGETDLHSLDPGGLEILVRTGSGPGSPAGQPGCGGGSDRVEENNLALTDQHAIDPQHFAAFAAALQSANHTLKRALTDPHLFSGIGNAYSDEILFAARLSPIKLTQKLSAEEIERLYVVTRDTLADWIERLRADAGEKFPEGVTAFRPDMAVHGRYKLPCLRCGAKIQRIRYATNETNYCPTCQTGGKLLADRALSRILRDDWPKTPEALG
jgi:formamidopyrimidine-DNA glycosylase